MSPALDQLLDRKYRLVRLLAEGGMGSVWAARHDKLGSEVAVKLMATKLAAASDARRRFEREAQAAAKLKSPHVVQVFDYGVEADTPYIVMELLEGEDLRARIRREHRLSIAESARIIGQACSGLAVAHAAGIVHRDLKPGNLFLARVGDDEITKILDFGVAKAREHDGDGDQTASGVVVGSPQWMSPEQARGQAVDQRSDLWSLGLIAYRLLTGRRLFQGRDLVDTALRVCTDPIPRATTLCPDLPPVIDTFFARALARDRELRFQSAQELGSALAELAEAHREHQPVINDSPSVETSGAKVSAVVLPTRDGTLTATSSEPAVAESAWRRGRWLMLGFVATAGALVWFLAAHRSSVEVEPAAALVPSIERPPAPDPSVSAEPSAAPPPATASSRAMAAPSAEPATSATRSPPRGSHPAGRKASPPASAPSAARHPIFGI